MLSVIPAQLTSQHRGSGGNEAQATWPGDGPIALLRALIELAARHKATL